jgi:RimJ/RimL family protein N-acetyltransferase
VSRAPSFPLDTERLRLRRFRGDDLAAFMAYRNDPEVARYQSWERMAVHDARRILREQRALVPGIPGRWLQIAVEERERGLLIGDCGLKVIRNEPWQAELGFTFSREHQGRGYASEAVGRLLRYAFEALALRRVLAITVCDNANSVALLERLGFRREGHFVENAWFKHRWESEFLYAMLADEWRLARR